MVYSSIAFKFKTVKGMLPLYDYFMINRLYSDFKYYRVTQIKKFIEIRDYKNSDFYSVELGPKNPGCTNRRILDPSY